MGRFEVKVTERREEWSKEREMLSSNSVDTPEYAKRRKRFSVEQTDRDAEWASKNPPVSSNSGADTPEASEPKHAEEPLSPLDER